MHEIVTSDIRTIESFLTCVKERKSVPLHGYIKSYTVYKVSGAVEVAFEFFSAEELRRGCQT